MKHNLTADKILTENQAERLLNEVEKAKDKAIADGKDLKYVTNANCQKAGLSMNCSIQLGNQQFSYELRRSKRKTLGIEVDAKGSLIVTAPDFIPLEKVEGA